jgi:hypothetical protein
MRLCGWLLFFLFPHPFRYPRPHMRLRNAYVSVAVNVPAVTSRYHGAVREISKVTRNKCRLRHIHVKINTTCTISQSVRKIQNISLESIQVVKDKQNTYEFTRYGGKIHKI